MKTVVDYGREAKTREERDEAALRDIQEYCSERQWGALMEMARQVREGLLTIDHIDRGMGIAGIGGYPFHAFCRKYCLEAYRTWMHTPDGDLRAVQTDEQGFRLNDQY